MVLNVVHVTIVAALFYFGHNTNQLKSIHKCISTLRPPFALKMEVFQLRLRYSILFYVLKIHPHGMSQQFIFIFIGTFHVKISDSILLNLYRVA